MTPRTHIYKTVGGCDIRADVYPAQNTTGPTPAVIWLHGGALMWGSCAYMTRPAQVALYTRAGYTYIAMDYRLAPETKVPEILADVRDGVRWVRGQGLAGLNVRPDRIGLIGHSAGGYLALLAGVCVDPPVQCVVSLYGYGDLAAPEYLTPSPHALQHPRQSEADARRAIGTQPVANAGRERGAFYTWCRQQGRWPYEVAGVAPGNVAALHPWSPMRRVTPACPPTFLAHGDQDSDVPHTLSIGMADALRQAGVPHEHKILPGFGHVFDDAFTDPAVVQTFNAVLDFLARNLKR